MIYLCICDDNQKDIEVLKQLIQKSHVKEQMHLDVFESGESLLFHCLDNINFFDVIFMDIEMAQLNGIQTMIEMRKRGYTGALVYLSSFKEYVFDSFDTKPLNYLLKWDCNEDKLLSIITAVLQEIGDREKCSISITTKQEQFFLKKKEIVYIASIKRKVCFHLSNGQVYECYAKLDEIHERLNARSFIRIHKSYIVNFDYINGLRENTIFLVNNITLPISRSQVKSVKHLIASLI